MTQYWEHHPLHFPLLLSAALMALEVTLPFPLVVLPGLLRLFLIGYLVESRVTLLVMAVPIGLSQTGDCMSAHLHNTPPHHTHNTPALTYFTYTHTSHHTCTHAQAIQTHTHCTSTHTTHVHTYAPTHYTYTITDSTCLFLFSFAPWMKKFT